MGYRKEHLNRMKNNKEQIEQARKAGDKQGVKQAKATRKRIHTNASDEERQRYYEWVGKR